MNEESFGARVLVGTYSWAGVDYKGKFSVSDMTHINAAKCQHVILTHYCFVFFFFFQSQGTAQIRNVEFFQSGQEGWIEDYDPRYSVSFLNLGQVGAVVVSHTARVTADQGGILHRRSL